MPERRLGDWLSHLERIHPESIDLGLARVGRVARGMGLLPFPVATLTVAGTNGKGSVVYSSEALLRAHGLRTGRYTSPHLLRFNERIAVDGTPVADERIVEAFEAIETARGATTLTYFEFATLAALWIFAESAVDVAILEVGLGGRLDATNIVDADVSVVTSISLDHQHWLGDNVESIGREKAAIARSARVCVLAERWYPSSVPETLRGLGAQALRAGDEWQWRYDDAAVCGLTVRLAGSETALQASLPAGLEPANVAAAIQASALLLRPEEPDPDVLRSALADLCVPARRQICRIAERTVVFDVAHNPASMTALAEQLIASAEAGQTVAALGLMADKDLPAMTAELARAVDGACALAIPGIDRAQSPEVIWAALDEAGIAIAQAEFSAEAVWEQLLTRTQAGDRIVICGSFHSVAGILAAIGMDPDPVTPDLQQQRG